MLGVAGQLASGKTRIADALGTELGWRVAGFGSFVRAQASSRASGTDRASLQELGAQLLEEYGPAGLSRRVLMAGGWLPGQPVVVEGIRHMEVARALAELVAPIEFRLIYLLMPEEVRLARAEARDGVAPKEVAGLERHSTEVQVPREIKDAADIIVDGTAEIAALVRDVVARLEDLGPCTTRAWP